MADPNYINLDDEGKPSPVELEDAEESIENIDITGDDDDYKDDGGDDEEEEMNEDDPNK